MSKPIQELVDELDAKSMTVSMLEALDFVVPGEWQNVVGFEETIKVVSGETDEKWVQKIGERAIHLYNDRSQGYQRAVWIYQTMDTVDKMLAASAIADKVGSKVTFLSFLTWITPKADKTQLLDFSLKLVGEVVAYCHINGIPGDSVGDFVKSLSNYKGAALMRMAALVSVDGMIPLGPEFVDATLDALEKLESSELANNEMFKRIQSLIPGANPTDQLGFVKHSVASSREWINSFIGERGLDVDKIVGNIRNFVDISDDKLDYLGAFLDLMTNYYEHTGIQTVAKQLIQRAAGEI